MIFYSTYNILDEVLYKEKLSGTIIDVQFSLNEEMGVMEESYGVKFDDIDYVRWVVLCLTFLPTVTQAPSNREILGTIIR